MPFRLKNVGATYQRLVNKLFHFLLRKTVEIYVDDMTVKSLQDGEHNGDLGGMFEILRRYDMKLNPKKCVFRAWSRKFLCFMIIKWGIKANPNKFTAVLHEALTEYQRSPAVDRIHHVLRLFHLKVS